MYISELVTGILLLAVCSVSHTFGTGKDVNVNSQLLKRLENLETMQKTEGDKVSRLEAEVRRQSSIVEEQQKKIHDLEETALKQRATPQHAFRMARSNRRKISFIKTVLLYKGLLDRDRTTAYLQEKTGSEEREHSNINSPITFTRHGENTKNFTVLKPRRKHGGKTDTSNTNHHSHSHSHKTVTTNKHTHLHSQTAKTDTSNTVHNQNPITLYGARDHHHSHHKHNQSSHNHAGNRNHDFQRQSLSAHNKHHGDRILNSHAKNTEVKHPGKHPNGHNGHHFSSSTRTTHQHHQEIQKTRHAVPNKPRTQHRSLKTPRQAFGGIAFSVYLDHDATLSQHEHVKFNKIITNDGGGYDAQTGVFTCAEGGVYMFIFSVGQRDQDHYMWAELMVNSQNIIDAVVDTYHPSQDLQGGNTVILRLKQGDRVWIDATHNGSHTEGSGTLRLTTFSGLFLYA